MTLPELAKQYLTYFGQKTRTNGDKFYFLKDNHPQILYDLVQKCHDDLLPDDYKYEYIHDSLTIISEQDNDSSMDDLHDECYRIESDVYIRDLLKWVRSNLHRISYCDIALTCNLNCFTSILMTAQQAERQEVYEEVLTILAWHIEEQDNASLSSRHCNKRKISISCKSTPIG